MPRYRDRRVPDRISTATPLDGPAFRVDFTDGYQPATTDTDLMQVVQGNKTAAWFNEVFYYRAQHVPGHNSDALVRFVETVAASGNVLEIENEGRTGRILGIDQHTGAMKLWDVPAAHLVPIAPTDTRPANLPAGVALHKSSMWASGTDPSVYGVRLMTVDPPTATLSRPAVSQEMWLAKILCNIDMMLTTISTRVRVSSGVTGVAGYTGYAVYDDGATMNLLGSTPDDTALFTSTGQKAKTLTTPVSLVAGNFYWLAMLANFSAGTLEFATTPSMSGVPGVTNSWPAGNTNVRFPAQTLFPAALTKTALTGNEVRPLIAGY